MGIPFIDFKFLKRAINQIDIEDTDLNIASNSKTEAILAKSNEEIDKKVNSYWRSSKAQRTEMLKEQKVTKGELKKEVVKPAKKQYNKEGREER